MPSLAELLADSDRRVLLAEGRANAAQLTTARLAVATLGAAVVTLEGAAPATLWAMGVYLVVGLVLFALARRVPSSADWLPWALPFVDVPLVAWAQDLRLAEGGTSPSGLVLAAACLNLGFVALASLTLSHRLVLATAAAGLVAFAQLAWRADVPWREADFPLLAFAVVSVVMAFNARRTLPLAIELRRQAWAGRYEMGRRLGAGGMAEVFEATLHRDDGTERRVALKRILPALASREDMQRLFMRELELAALMSHPNIVQVLDSGADEQGPFLVMEYVEGRPLSRVLRSAAQRQEPISPSSCLHLAEQLLHALEHIHTRRGADGAPLSLMHRDLNPPNVLVTLQGEVKVADFGIARPALEARVTLSNELRGKLAYSAPEQLLGHALTPSLDLFALGILLAEVALGAHPFQPGETVALERQLAGQLPQLGTARPDLPPEFVALVLRLLEPSPERRCASATSGLVQLRALRWDAEAARAELSRLARDEAAGLDETTRPA